MDPWGSYLLAEELMLKDEERKMLMYESVPEDHPRYSEEWAVFWQRRYSEVQESGRNPEQHNYLADWIPFWGRRIKELAFEEVELKRRQLKRQFGFEHAADVAAAGAPPRPASRTSFLAQLQPEIISLPSQQHNTSQRSRSRSRGRSSSHFNRKSRSCSRSPGRVRSRSRSRGRSGLHRSIRSRSRSQSRELRKRSRSPKGDSARREAPLFLEDEASFRQRKLAKDVDSKRDHKNRLETDEKYRNEETREAKRKRKKDKTRSKKLQIGLKKALEGGQLGSGELDLQRILEIALKSSLDSDSSNSSSSDDEDAGRLSKKMKKKSSKDESSSGRRAGSVRLVSVLRLLKVFEDSLGGLAGSVTGLLSKATALENAHEGSSKILLEETTTLTTLEMARIKLTALLASGSVQSSLAEAMANCLDHLSRLLKQIVPDLPDSKIASRTSSPPPFQPKVVDYEHASKPMCLNNYLSSEMAVQSFLARAVAQVLVVTGKQPAAKELEGLLEELLENLAETEQDTTIGLLAKDFTQACKARKQQFQEQQRSIFSMLYNFSSETSQKSEKPPPVAVPQPFPSRNKNLESPPPVQLSKGETYWYNEDDGTSEKFSSEIDSNKKLDARKEESNRRLDVSPDVIDVDADDEISFTSTELKMLLLNFENLSPEEQLNLTDYLRRQGSAAPAATEASNVLPKVGSGAALKSSSADTTSRIAHTTEPLVARDSPSSAALSSLGARREVASPKLHQTERQSGRETVGTEPPSSMFARRSPEPSKNAVPETTSYAGAGAGGGGDLSGRRPAANALMDQKISSYSNWERKAALRAQKGDTGKKIEMRLPTALPEEDEQARLTKEMEQMEWELELERQKNQSTGAKLGDTKLDERIRKKGSTETMTLFTADDSSGTLVIKCNLCEMNIYGVKNLSAHHGGKKHAKNLTDGQWELVPESSDHSTTNKGLQHERQTKDVDYGALKDILYAVGNQSY